MKETFKIISVLTVVCAVCAFLLTFVYSSAQTKITDNAKDKTRRALKSLAPEAENFEEDTIDGIVIYKLIDKNKKLIGYGFIAAGQGYQGTIEMMAVVDANFDKLQGIEIIKSLETPGLGSKINDSSFRGQFNDLSAATPIECVKEEIMKKNQIKAVTGATVSSRAVTNILNARLKEIRTAMEQLR
jgi:Na+-translocating ferredoxin:NAD+ oxidoreductase subunit G